MSSSLTAMGNPVKKTHPSSKMSMAIGSGKALREESSESEDELAVAKLDYTLPVTASEIFRANFLMNKTLKKKKNVKQWIPNSNEYWFQLKNQLADMIVNLTQTIFSENIFNAKEAGDFWRSSVD